MSIYDLMIIGAGPAGLTAALYASRAGLKTLVLEKGSIGGQIATTATVENYPGIESISGPELTEKMAAQAKKFGAEIKEFTDVTSIDLEAKMKKAKTPSGSFEAKSILLATGSREKKLGIKGESELKGKGVSYCATCDGAFFRGKEIVVVGGGNSAFEEAVFLTRFAKTVSIIHRRSAFRADKVLQEKAKANPKMKFILDSVLESISGSKHVESISVRDVKTNKTSEIKCDGVFIYVGTIPNTELFLGKIALDNYGYIIVDNSMKTSIPGVFAAGDVTHSKVKQVTTATGDGTIASISAEKYISGE